MRQNNRFSDKKFLQNLGFETIRSLVTYVFRGIYHVFLRYCIFAGILGSFWVMAVIEPQGPLLLYMVPALLLALPLVFLSDQHTAWEKVFSAILLLSIIGGAVGILFYLYEVHEQHSGQLIFYVFIAVVGCITAGFQIFRKRSRRGLNERRGGTIRVLWAIGILYLPVLLGSIFYYRLWHSKTLESSASILFCALAFVICLTLAIIRIFWMDALRNYRAMRVGEYPSEDAVNLLELLIPRSMFLVVMVPCLLFSEAVMFSVVYRVTQASEARRTSQHPPLQRTQVTQTAPVQRNTAPPLATPATPPQTKKSNGGYRFLAWLNFAIRPYVFPKNEDGTELNAPAWIKPFGRILLSLIILLLFTHQLNIWNLYKNCYLSLFNLARKGTGNPETAPELQRQWRELELSMRSLLNNYGSVWRWLILFACTAPTHWLSWKWLLDPGYAFLETVDRVYQYCKHHWGIAVLGGALFLTLVTLPFALVYNANTAFWFCVLPSFIVGILLFVSQQFMEPHPPQIRSWLLPWLYPTHLLVSLLFFFVALSVRDVHHASLQFLWYISLTTVIMYPILYWFGGERMLPPEPDNGETITWRNSRQVRLAILDQFFHIEHRSWVLAALIYRIHPVRSRMMSARYVLPSLQLGFFQWLRERVKNVEDARQQMLSNINHALNTHLLILVALFLPALIAVSFNTSKQAGTVFYQVSYTLLCAAIPCLVLYLINEISHHWLHKSIDEFPISPRRLFLWLTALTISAIVALFAYFNLAAWPQRLVMAGIAYLFFFPWLEFASWRHLRNLRSRNSNEDLSASKIERPSRLGHWIEVLRRKENDALSHVYNKVHVWGRTDLYTRDHMCEGLVELITNTQRSLTSERWFSEEARELERVTHLWFGEGDVVDPEDLTKPAEVLSSLLNDALDVLGSVLYDQTDLERREMLPPHKAPELKIVLRVLEDLLRLSFPPQYVSNKRGAPPQSLVELQQTRGDLQELVVNLLRQTFRNESHVDIELCREYRGELLRVLRLLDVDAYEKFAHKYTAPHWLAASTQAQASGEELAETLVSSTWERTEALLRLPTPIAQFYQDIYHIRLKIEQIVQQEDVYVTPVQLHRTQEHHILREYRKNWCIEHELSIYRQQMWISQGHLYQELLGYILAGLKTNLPFQTKYAEWLNLHWHSPEARAHTYQWLQQESPDQTNVDFWIDLYIRAYDGDLSVMLSQQTVEPSTQDWALERLEAILMDLEPALCHEAPLLWYKDIPIPGPEQREVKVTVEVNFQSANPQVHFVSGPAEQYKEAEARLLRDGALLWTGEEPHEFRRLEIWIARWLLDLLWQASRSWELWVPKDEASNHIEYRKKNLDQLEHLLQKLGELLPMASREDQEAIDQWFRRIDRRIALLHRNLHKPQDETPLETSLSYQSVIQTVASKLQEMEILGQMRMAQLVHTGLLPHCTFQYLSDVIFADGETLLRYQYGNGKHGTIKPVSQKPLPADLHARAPWVHDPPPSPINGTYNAEETNDWVKTDRPVS